MLEGVAVDMEGGTKAEPENERVEEGFLADHTDQTLAVAAQDGSSMEEEFGDLGLGLPVQS
jgi:hypothetical protein